jgi:pilus assembly protein CpaF
MTMKTFFDLCKEIFDSFETQWNHDSKELDQVNVHLKLALQGYPEGEKFFKEKIEDYLETYERKNAAFPEYYSNLVDAIYHENWGYAGMAEWFDEKYANISSAKIISDRIYFLIDGIDTLMPQRISDERRAQLVKKLLSIVPAERTNKDYHEIQLLDEIRITIYNEAMSKKSQDAIVFRRYTIPRYTFEMQEEHGTISKEMIPLFKSMVPLGYNLAITGPVRSAKTTFLATWQSYEDPTLEGVIIETSPEIPIHKIMPSAPIIQLIADGELLKSITKPLMRSDADYLIMAEARDGIAFDIAVKIASKGTRRCKMTAHIKNPLDFCEDVASEIVKSLGGDVPLIAAKVAKSVDYIFHFRQLRDKSKKRLHSIHEMTYDRKTGKIIVTEICKYYPNKDNWGFRFNISKDKEFEGREENESEFIRFENILKELATKFPIDSREGDGTHVFDYK